MNRFGKIVSLAGFVLVVAQAMVDNFAFVPDHYVTVEQAAFIQFIDDSGGIEVRLTSAVDGASESLGTYRAGVNQWVGLRALLVRTLSRWTQSGASRRPCGFTIFIEVTQSTGFLACLGSRGNQTTLYGVIVLIKKKSPGYPTVPENGARTSTDERGGMKKPEKMPFKWVK